MRRNRTSIYLLVALALGSSGCVGAITDAGEAPGGDAPSLSGDDPGAQLVEVGLTRLTPLEYDNTVRDLLGALVRPSAEVLPLERPDPGEDYPFDTHYPSQQVSATLIEASETLATEAARSLLEDATRRDEVVGCAPAGPEDAACLRDFIARFGRLAFRRPLEDAQIDRYTTLIDHAAAAGDFYVAVEGVIRAMLMSPSFLYKVEIGTPLPGAPEVFRLDGYEVAARMSYFLWGSMPDEALLDDAESGRLDTPEGIRAAAERMLDDPRAAAQVARFHAQWLGLGEHLADDALGARMRAESEALITRVVFEERRPWSELFTFEETFVDDALAAHYGMPLPGGDAPRWVRYEDRPGGRGGLLSHGAFLSAGALGDDPSPMKRGHLITTTLLCAPIPPPPPEVSTELPGSPETDCVQERLQIHAQGACAGCHQFMDPIGFGLDRYDALGRFRTHEAGRPDCEVSGEGRLPAMGESAAADFEGPAELGALVVDGRVQRCVASQLYRFAVGRNVRESIGALPAIHAEDLPLVEHLAERFAETDDFQGALLDIVSAPFFRHRVVATEEP